MLDLACATFLEDRGIDIEVATKYGISTANVTGIHGKSVLVLPYTEDGVLVNEKFRMLPKEKFWQHKGRRKIFWNVDALNDGALDAAIGEPLIVTEGELDALAAIQCGFPLSVSVPDGAPPAGPHDTEEHSGSDDQDGRFSFLWNARHKLKKVYRFILATDNDGPGIRLRDELIARLGAGRCSFIEYPAGCKDINDVLLKCGPEAVTLMLNTAKPCPVRGLYRLDDYPDMGPLQTYDAGFPFLEPHLKVIPGEFIVLTGIPQHGKSSFALHLLANLAELHGWRSAMFSPEMKVVPIVRDRLMQIRCRQSQPSPEQMAWVADNFVFISADPSGDDSDDDFDLNFVLDVATEAVMRHGIKVLLIDPWNEVEHARGKGETMTEYVARGIRAIKRFARKHQVVVIVVAHPTKLEFDKKTNGFVRPTLYDISDSAAWYNKCDHGLVVYRDFEQRTTEVSVMKSRFDEAGEPGMVRMKFNSHTHRFEALDGNTEGGIDP